MTDYTLAFKRIKTLISTYSWLKLQIVNKPKGYIGGLYNPDKKLIHINRHHQTKQSFMRILIHQFFHAMQDMEGFFQQKYNLYQGQLLQDKILKHQLKYVKRFHRKYINQLLKMQYDCDMRAYYFLTNEQSRLIKILPPLKYISIANFNINNLKYMILKGIKQPLTDSLYSQAPFPKDRVLTQRQLLKQFNSCQLRFFEKHYKK